MLAPHEMVLSPHERANADASSASPAAPVSSADAAAALQEIDALRAQLKRAHERQALLEVLTGVQVADASERDEYVCSLFSEPRTAITHWRAKHVAPATLDDTKVLRYNVRLPELEKIAKDEAVLLSYLGPAPGSDAELLQRLPDHFQGQVSVKIENAPLFEQRLQSLVQGP